MKNLILPIIFVVLGLLPRPATAKTFTLSAQALACLDDTIVEEAGMKPFHAVVVGKRQRPQGVEFDVLFPDLTNRGRRLSLTSNGTRGAGILSGISVTDFEKFKLKFTLLSFDGVSTSSGQVFVATMLRPGRSGEQFASHAKPISLPSNPVFASEVTSPGPKIESIGFTISLPPSAATDKQSHLVTVLVESAADSIALTPVFPKEPAQTCSLSNDAIMALDDVEAARFYSPPMLAKVVARRPRSEGGVELDIHFPGIKVRENTLHLTSNSRTGEGALVGIELSEFEAYELKFTVLSADGSKLQCPNISVGALIGPGSTSPTFGYAPAGISLPTRPSAVSSTSNLGGKSWIVGLQISLFNGNWPEGPHDVTILVEPTKETKLLYPNQGHGAKPAATPPTKQNESAVSDGVRKGMRPFTLSQEGLLALDDSQAAHWFQPPMAVTVTKRRPVASGGVEFDLHFPGGLRGGSLYLTSNSKSGVMTLAGLDVSSFDSYKLKFTLLSVDGAKAYPGSIGVGALIAPNGKSSGYSYRPESLNFSKTPTISETVGIGSPVTAIGFMVSLFRNSTDEEHDLTLLVEPAENATLLPQNVK